MDSFNEWIAKVDAILEEATGLRLIDLPDLPTREAWNAGTHPRAFVRKHFSKLGLGAFGG